MVFLQGHGDNRHLVHVRYEEQGVGHRLCIGDRHLELQGSVVLFHGRGLAVDDQLDVRRVDEEVVLDRGRLEARAIACEDFERVLAVGEVVQLHTPGPLVRELVVAAKEREFLFLAVEPNLNVLDLGTEVFRLTREFDRPAVDRVDGVVEDDVGFDRVFQDVLAEVDGLADFDVAVRERIGIVAVAGGITRDHAVRTGGHVDAEVALLVGGSQVAVDGILDFDEDAGMVGAALVLHVAHEDTVGVLQVDEEEGARALLAVFALDLVGEHGVVAVGHPDVPVNAARKFELVVAVGIDGHEVRFLEVVGDEVAVCEVRDEFFDARVALDGVRRTYEVPQGGRVIGVDGFVVEDQTFLFVLRGVVFGADELEFRLLVEVEVHAIAGLVAVVVGDDDVDLLVTDRIHLGGIVLDGHLDGVPTELFVFPFFGLALAAGVEVDLEALDGAEGIEGDNREGDVALGARPERVLRDVQVRGRVDNADILADTGGVAGVVAVDGDKERAVEAGFGIDAEERGGVRAVFGHVVTALAGFAVGVELAVLLERVLVVLAIGLFEVPDVAVDLVGVVAEEPHQVHRVVDGDGKGVVHQDGIRVA